jgi:hypothetical protein
MLCSRSSSEGFAVKAKSPESQGKIEAYHRSLQRWFVDELQAQEVVGLEHLQQLLEAMLELVYNRHEHRETGMRPEHRLAGRLSDRRVDPQQLANAFFVDTIAKSDKKTGEVRLPVGRFRVPVAFAGQRSRFRHHPVRDGRAVLMAGDGREIALQPFAIKPLSVLKPRVQPRGTGQLQKLLDVRDGKRPNAQPGFGLPEVFAQIGVLLGRLAPRDEHEANAVSAFYRKWGPLPREAFVTACQRTQRALGEGRPLSVYLADLERQIAQERTEVESDTDTDTDTDQPDSQDEEPDS